MSQFDTAFQVSMSNLRFGQGATREIGMDLEDLGLKRTLLVIDPRLRDLPTGHVVLAALRSSRVDFEVFDAVEVEPTDRSFHKAIDVAKRGNFDSFVAVGGGSTIDTAKAANLYSTWPAEFLDYVNAPIGRGLPVPGPLKPLIAVPTTAGTGSETTGVAIFDLLERKAKTGIAHRYLKPLLAIVDPDNTRTQPPAVAAAAGLDVLSHALESYTAIPFDRRPRPERPSLRPAYQGTNPISDMWAIKALEMVAEFLPRAVADTERRRGPQPDGARRRHGRHWLWKRRRAPAARHVLRRRRHGPRFSAARLRHRSPAGAARHVGDPAHAGGGAFYGIGLSRAASAGCGRARGRYCWSCGRTTPARFSPQRVIHLHEAPPHAKRTRRRRLSRGRYSGARRRNAAAASRDKAFASPGGRSGADPSYSERH